MNVNLNSNNTLNAYSQIADLSSSSLGMSILDNAKVKTNTSTINSKNSSNNFTWSSFWNICKDVAGIVSGKKTISGTIKAIKSAYSTITGWFSKD